MNQDERRQYLIQYLLDEDPQYKKVRIPASPAGQKQLLRGLMNIREPKNIGEEFLLVQDEYLSEENRRAGIVDIRDLPPCGSEERFYLWQGDITRLKVDGICNAANEQLTGCYIPGHNCIDNCIHTYAGVQLRKKCGDIMRVQGHPEPPGQAKITPAYNLPCKYVLHTVGPIVQGRLTEEHERLLASCYTSCLELAAENSLESIAFCCISTGVFMFPNQRAAEIAVETVRDFLARDASIKKVVFNVFKDEDLRIYERLLG